MPGGFAEAACLASAAAGLSAALEPCARTEVALSENERIQKKIETDEVERVLMLADEVYAIFFVSSSDAFITLSFGRNQISGWKRLNIANLGFRTHLETK